MTVYGKATIWIILASATMTVMGGAIIAPVLNLMREGLGVDPSAARVLITTHSIFIALFSPLYGVLIDRIGPRRPFALGLALWGISGGIGLFINDYWLLLTSRALLGFGAAAIFTSITVLILDLYKQGAERNKVMGWRASSQSVGGVIWPLLGGFLGTFSWHFPFAVYLIGIPLGLLALLYVPQTHREQAVAPSGKEKTVLMLLRENPMLFGIYWLILLSSVLLYGLVVFLPEVLKELGVTSPFYIGLYISGMGLVAGISALMYGRIRAKLSYKTIVVTALALWAIGFATLSRASTSFLVGLSVAFFGAGQGMVMPTVQLWAGELVPASFRGRITSYLGSFGLGGQFLSPIILSPLESSLGLNAVFLIIGVTCALVLVSFLVLVRQQGAPQVRGKQ
jgi:ACDE family multidrug resistance protein